MEDTTVDTRQSCVSLPGLPLGTCFSRKAGSTYIYRKRDRGFRRFKVAFSWLSLQWLKKGRAFDHRSSVTFSETKGGAAVVSPSGVVGLWDLVDL